MKNPTPPPSLVGGLLLGLLLLGLFVAVAALAGVASGCYGFGAPRGIY